MAGTSGTSERPTEAGRANDGVRRYSGELGMQASPPQGDVLLQVSAAPFPPWEALHTAWFGSCVASRPSEFRRERASDAERERERERERESPTNLEGGYTPTTEREALQSTRALPANPRHRHRLALVKARRSRRTSRRERTRRYEMFGPRSGHSLGTEIETWRTSTWMTTSWGTSHAFSSVTRPLSSSSSSVPSWR